jgi:hypothetical protein
MGRDAPIWRRIHRAQLAASRQSSERERNRRGCSTDRRGNEPTELRNVWCGLDHTPDELFVAVGVEGLHRLVVVDTCELEGAWAAAHAKPQPAGAVAYHATRHPEEVLEVGLDPALATSPCNHVCLAETAEIAAGGDMGSVVVEVDVSGLDLFFELGEAHHHGSVGPGISSPSGRAIVPASRSCT